MGEPTAQPASWTTRILVDIAPDGMRASVDLRAVSEDHKPESLADAIRAALSEAGVIKGVDNTAIKVAAESYLSKSGPVHAVVALGLPPVEGTSARCTFQFLLDGKDPSIVAQERQTGGIDEKALVKPCVRAGDVLAVAEPGQPGTDGYTVTGATLSVPPSSDATLKTGSGVQILDDGHTYAVAQDTIGYANYLDGTLTVEPPVIVSDDAMEARLLVHPPRDGRASFTLAEVERWLDTNGIVYGVCHDAIAAVLANADRLDVPAHDVIIASGTPPAPGENARIEFQFRREPLAGWIRDGETQIDYHERGFFQRVQKGDVLARKIPATPGIPGSDIYGKEMPPVPGSDAVLGAAGEAVLSEDGLECHAANDGVVVAADAETIGVFQEFTVPGDVDLHTGNLDMNGVLLVKGWVRSGFRVHATGNLLIGGGVETSIVETDANLAVKHGVLGGNQGRIGSKGDLAADFIENAHVQAGGNVTVCKSILNSQVTAEGCVVATEGKGQIIGGTTRAAKGVEVNELGSRAAVRTIVDVGLDTAARAKLAEMEHECALFERNQQKIGKALAAFVQRSKSRKPEPQAVQALAKLAHFRRDIELKRRDIASFWKRLEGAPATVKVRKSVHEGVVIVVMGRRLDIHEDILNPGEFTFDTGNGQVTYRT